MKKLHNKAYHDKVAKRNHIHELKRKDKQYDHKIVNLDALTQTFQERKPKLRKKTIIPPKEFSLIYNVNESLAFFEEFVRYSEMYDYIIINMKDVKVLTMEVLLYLISLQKINKSKDIKTSMKIEAPKLQHLKELMAQSGLSKYFTADTNVAINYDDILPIQDGEMNRINNIDDTETCKNAIEYALKFFPNASFTDEKFSRMYDALAEMMTNTDNHAYNKEGELRNWYLFAIRVEGGVSFYFFDNGQGVLKTARKNLLERAIEKAPFSLGYESIMASILSGEYKRSMTGKAYRNKGLPEINSFLTNNHVSLPLILTNKIRMFHAPEQKEYEIIKHNFRGTLFIWILKDEEKTDVSN